MHITSDKVREAKVAIKLQHWYNVATSPGTMQRNVIDARRNYWRLIRKHPQIAKKHGWTEEKILLGAA